MTGDVLSIDPPEVRYRISWSARRRRSYGGTYKAGWRDEMLPDEADPMDWRYKGAGISLAVRDLPADLDAAMTHREYATLRYDPEIGAFGGTARQRWQVLICHEIAYAIDHALGDEKPSALSEAMADNPEIPTGKLKGHGHRWQTIYRLFRRHMGLTQDDGSIATHTDKLPRCRVCGAEFQPRRATARFCSGKCRTAAYRKERKAKKAVNSGTD